MKWLEYTIKTTTEAEDLVCDMLMELGIEGVEILDNVPLTQKEKELMFIDIVAVLPPDDGTAYVRFYLEESELENEEEWLSKVRDGLEELEAFCEVGEGTIEKGVSEDVDWINNWKEFFKPFYLDNILIKPSWEPIPEGAVYDALVEIDPGTSFGTGQHETTQLCIRGLRHFMKPGDKVLDLGCGSGILSIIALKLGAKDVVGTDIDPICMEATDENMERNHIGKERYTTYCGNLIDDEVLQEQVGKDKYDIVLANILADVIIPMTPAAYACVKQGGYFVTSGIIDFKEEPVKKALTEAGFSIVEAFEMGEWRGVVARK